MQLKSSLNEEPEDAFSETYNQLYGECKVHGKLETSPYIVDPSNRQKSKFVQLQ